MIESGHEHDVAAAMDPEREFARFNRDLVDILGSPDGDFAGNVARFLHRVAARRSNIDSGVLEFAAGAQDFLQGPLHFCPPGGILSAVVDALDDLFGDSQQALAEVRVDFALDGLFLGTINPLMLQVEDVKRRHEDAQQQQDADAKEHQRPPGRAVNEIADGLEHDPLRVVPTPTGSRWPVVERKQQLLGGKRQELDQLPKIPRQSPTE
ncbi:MAG: hypothetical protein K0B16_06760 [Burkholderiaceae bacterium]|nr:hypothetical protein [Burkholderiaceae bacterium]